MKAKITNFKKICQKYDYLFLIIISILYEICLFLFESTKNIKEIAMIFFILIIILVLFDKKNIPKNIFYLLYIIGIIIRTEYIYNTSIYIRQHDVGKINSGDNGHLEYIYTLYKFNKLPQTVEWQFYHPPFWHAIAALWLKIGDLLKIDFYRNLEGIQIITLLLSSSIIVIVDKIGYKLKFKNVYRLLTDMIFVFHPTMILFSGSINNDCLLLFLEFLIIYELIRWYETPSWENTIILANITGLCVMTKANGAIMAMPILYIFIAKLIYFIKKKKEEIKDWFLKIINFGLISLPIGLWYQIRRIILFKEIPLIPAPGLRKIDISIKDRFFTLNFKELLNGFSNLEDTNLPAYLIKSSIFGEYAYDNIDKLKLIIVIINSILIIISILLIISYLFYKKKSIHMNAMLITWITSIISMYFFNYGYPYFCSMDFRYIVICLLPGVMIMSYFMNENHKITNIPFILLYISFSITSLMINFETLLS